MKRLAAALGLVLLAHGAAAAETRTWRFSVFLDDRAIGYHLFRLKEEGTQRELASEARFNVKMLGIELYRYVHDAAERWRGNCLEALNARTDDNGEATSVSVEREGERLAVSTPRGRQALDGCVMTFAYWNPQMLKQSRLLNVQTGTFNAVQIAALPNENIMFRGAEVPARRFRITGEKNPIDLWYSPEGEWLGLESTVSGGRRLRYRIP